MSRWYGRFGNNVIQLVNACCVAQARGIEKVIFPPSEYFLGTQINIEPCGTKFESQGHICSDFFSFSEMEMILGYRPTYDLMQTIGIRYIAPIVKGLDWAVAKFGNIRTECSVHLRGGDIFSKRPHPRYVPPPVNYFKFFVSKEKTFQLVAEDFKHPASGFLLSSGNCYTKESLVISDVAKLGLSKSIIVGPGTFWFAAFLLMRGIEKVVVPVYRFADGSYHDVWRSEGWPNEFHLVKSYMEGYICAGQWRNRFWQRRYINTYPFCEKASIRSSRYV